MKTLSKIQNSRILIRSSLLFLFVLFTSTNTKAQLKIGDLAPEIKLPDSLGKWTKLSEVKSDIVLIDFWAAWCPPCIITAQELKKIKDDFNDASFEIFAVSLDRDYWKWVKMERKLNLPFIHVNDAYGLKSPRCKAYGVTSIPKKFLVIDGKVAAINPTFDQIREAIKKSESTH